LQAVPQILISVAADLVTSRPCGLWSHGFSESRCVTLSVVGKPFAARPRTIDDDHCTQTSQGDLSLALALGQVRRDQHFDQRDVSSHCGAGRERPGHVMKFMIQNSKKKSCARSRTPGGDKCELSGRRANPSCLAPRQNFGRQESIRDVGQTFFRSSQPRDRHHVNVVRPGARAGLWTPRRRAGGWTPMLILVHDPEA